MARGKGKPCGASHIANSKVCRVGLASEVNRAINAATGEIGAASLKAAVQKYAGGQGVNRLREIRREIREEMGGNIVKGPRADELKKRLQNEGLLPPKGKSAPPDVKAQLAALDGPTNRALKKEYNKLDKEQKELERQLADLKAQVKGEKPPSKPDPLYGAWPTDKLRSFRGGFKEDDPRFEGVRNQIDRELARRDGKRAAEEAMSGPAKPKSQIAQLQSVLGLGAQTRKDIGRDLEGLEDEARNLQRNLKEEIQAAKPGSRERNQLIDRLKAVDAALDAGKTNADVATRSARESARSFDDQLRREETRREGDARFNKWEETTGKGSKKLGQGAYGTVMTPGDKGYAVKRGDISDTEAALIKRLGEADLGPKLIAADIDGRGRMDNPGVDVRNGRLAMSIVPGSPIGSKKPDKEIGGVKVADAYWTARANLHRMGIAHNDMHIDNVLIDRKGKGRFVDMGLAQDLPKAALAEALGAFEKPRGAMVTRPSGVQGQGDWQVRRWEGTAGRLLSAAHGNEPSRRELERRAPVAARVLDNKNALQFQMQKDGFSKDDIATMMDHGLRNRPSTYDEGVWARLSNDQAMKYINMLYEGV